jgi:protein arginine kinase activator
MPLCQICKQREATVHLTQIVNGQKAQMYICSQCAGANAVKIDLNSLLTGLLGFDNKAEETHENEIKCDQCGMTAEDFNKTGRMGCSHCYEVFFEPMQDLLTRIQGNTIHRGKTPKKFEHEQTSEEQVEQLKTELQECIRTEAYERAAQIRDRIKYLESGEGGRKS